MKPLRVGVVGVGYLGRFHAQKYAAMADVDLVGVVDASPSRAEEVAQELNVPAFKAPEELFGKVDAVSIVVPTPGHYAVGMAFLDQGVDVLMEKPITVTLEEADRLIALADAKGRILQVGHLERFNPAVKGLADLVSNPRFIDAGRLSLFQPRGTDVSVVLDLMIHDIDIILSLVKSRITRIQAAGTCVVTDQVDIANARLEFETGCVANVTASRVSLKTERKMRIFQEHAYISMDFANHDITLVRKSDAADGSPIPKASIQQRPFAKGDALAEEIRAFVDSVRHRTQPEVSGKVGRDALAIALAVMDQIQITGR